MNENTSAEPVYTLATIKNENDGASAHRCKKRGMDNGTEMWNLGLGDKNKNKNLGVDGDFSGV